MSLQNKVPLSIVDLNADCLFEVFSYLKLSDVVNFRFQCSVLNDVVLKYLFSTTKISILYTEHEDPEEGPQDSKRARVQSQSSSRQFSSQTIRDFLNETLEYCTSNLHCRSEDFIVISGEQKYVKFLRFIEKYLPNIKKLALVMDPNPAEYAVFSSVTELLKACPKIESLFLERTYRGMYAWLTRDNWTFKIDDLGRLLVTIAGLSSLKKLHFFANHTTSINLAGFESLHEPMNLASTMISHFLLTMFNKLRIFHINNFRFQKVHTFWKADYVDPLLGRTLDDILELGFESKDCMQLTNSGTIFEKLHSLTLINYCWREFEENIIGNSFQKLKILSFQGTVSL